MVHTTCMQHLNPICEDELLGVSSSLSTFAPPRLKNENRIAWATKTSPTVCLLVKTLLRSCHRPSIYSLW
jgi:hypothetical protein